MPENAEIRNDALDPRNYNKLYLNGQYVKAQSKDTYSLKNPKNNTTVIEDIPIAGPADVDAAVGYAEEAFRGPWSQFTALQRTECFLRLVTLLDNELTPILEMDSLTSGIPISLAPIRELNYIRNCVLYYAGWTDKQKGDYYPADDGFVKLIRHEPIGVCAAINPFNAPLATFFLKAAPALATGNVMILKPSEKTPLGSLAASPLFEKAGFPPGVIQVITGPGSTGALLAEHMKIRKLSFTGSLGTGRLIQVAAARSNLKRVTLELGGKSPALIFEDANLDNALTWTINAILTRSGQLCVAASRVYVQRSIADQFIKEYTRRMELAINDFGDPQDPTTKLGPMVDASQLERVMGMVERGRSEAELIVGGLQFGDTGCYMQPTVFLNPKDDAEIYRNEIFGPVSIIKTFDTEEEALKMANNTEFGLMSGVFTRDITRALRVSSSLDSGVVGINCVSLQSLQAPFGGRKQSGVGREFGEYALRLFTEPKTVLINMGA
ncbi:aldehyde dehydrogenase mitochondrial precursor [Aaosphaeria arxii CBS 175.79]|uniref:aldehyde dehydrogenase (NAD(+)) n=1 Tax=Aaosphaeria arxii CBS 175.79 TaxID=1450172 RepID=A0A6A5Y5M5_9PLEO|nr:aldehyde dehydrogenase mitochondrial precursor [Aaosphaeria arxii CBS 175.79]KAF2020080.1 aldehyde dehydrogenase mitochondrial precursor [Aaosphaeria arxii CBS 175.79]